MTAVSHPGDFLWIIAGGRFLAMTHDAYDLARRIVETQEPDMYEGLRERNLGIGEMYKLALGILESDGEVRLELREPPTGDDYRVPVYAVAPPETATKAQQRRVKRTRKRALAVVGGTAAE